MNEYISKQRAKDLMGCCLASTKAEYKAAKDEFTKARFGDYISAIQSMIDVIDKVEVAAVQIVKHGRWSECFTDSRIYSGICSVCGGGAIRSVIAKPLDYCPNCGARMDGDTECQ